MFDVTFCSHPAVRRHDPWSTKRSGGHCKLLIRYRVEKVRHNPYYGQVEREKIILLLQTTTNMLATPQRTPSTMMWSPGAQENVRLLCRSTTSGLAHWSPFGEIERVEPEQHNTNATTEPTGQTGQQPTTLAPATEAWECTLERSLLAHHSNDCPLRVVVDESD